MSAWIARDKNNTLTVFEEKPFDRNGTWISNIAGIMFLNKKEYPEVTYENSPVELKTNIL